MARLSHWLLLVNLHQMDGRCSILHGKIVAFFKIVFVAIFWTEKEVLFLLLFKLLLHLMAELAWESFMVWYCHKKSVWNSLCWRISVDLFCYFQVYFCELYSNRCYKKCIYIFCSICHGWGFNQFSKGIEVFNIHTANTVCWLLYGR